MAAIIFACNCGQKLRAPEVNAGRKASCPKCGAVITIPARRPHHGEQRDLAAAAPAPPRHVPPVSPRQVAAQGSTKATGRVLPRTMRANRRYAGKVCSICQAQLRFGEQLRICEQCRLAFHQACWEENKGCGTYGCPSGPQAEPPASAAPPLPPTPASLAPRVPAKGRRVWWVGAAVALVLLGIVSLIHVVEYTNLQGPMNKVLSSDPRNSGVKVRCRYRSWTSHGVLVYDLREVPPSKSQADVFRVFLQYAAKLHGRRVDTVQLSYRGRVKFLLAGEDFAVLGRDYGTENPIYTIRTFPEKLRKPDGTRAFAAWTGGLLGVLNRQMEDFDAFHKQWYGSELLSSAER